MLTRLLPKSQYIMILAVLGTLLGSIALTVYQIAVMISASIDVFKHAELTPKTSKIYAVRVVESVDVFLIAIAVYIISIGLYALFVDDRVKLPSWLKLTNLEDLKAHLLSVVIAVLAVLFLSEAVAWEGEKDILGFGLAIAAIIASLALFLKPSR